MRIGDTVRVCSSDNLEFVADKVSYGDVGKVIQLHENPNKVFVKFPVGVYVMYIRFLEFVYFAD